MSTQTKGQHTPGESLADRVERGEEVRIRNPKKFDRLCEDLDRRGFEYATPRGIGGWHVRRLGFAAVTKEAGHTPAPWAVDGTDDRWLWVTGPDRSAPVICDVVPRDDKQPNPEDHANARLIAAAPELLSCLEEAERMVDFDVEQMGVVDRWRAAIAKARGEG